jgi:hypothetical protein
MNLLLLLFSTVMLFSGCKSQESPPPPIPPELDILRQDVPDSLKHLLPILDSVYYRDQLYRGSDIKEISAHKKELIRINDSLNLLVIKPIINKYGILSMKEIGMIGNFALTLTIQHAELPDQIFFLPYFEEAFKKKAVLPSTYAMLVDRINVKSGKMQIYGTQVAVSKKSGELLPTIDIDSINSRRKSIGMAETIETYLQRFGIKWDIEKYKNDLPALKAKYKID